jgi:hypothetical protein
MKWEFLMDIAMKLPCVITNKNTDRLRAVYTRTTRLANIAQLRYPLLIIPKGFVVQIPKYINSQNGVGSVRYPEARQTGRVIGTFQLREGVVLILILVESIGTYDHKKSTLSYGMSVIPLDWIFSTPQARRVIRQQTQRARPALMPIVYPSLIKRALHILFSPNLLRI